MAIGKNKKGKKGGRKKVIEPMTRKDWYDVQVPATFAVRKIGKTLVNRTAGLSAFSSVAAGARIRAICCCSVYPWRCLARVPVWLVSALMCALHAMPCGVHPAGTCTVATSRRGRLPKSSSV